jgi:hypothetical protein
MRFCRKRWRLWMGCLQNTDVPDHPNKPTNHRRDKEWQPRSTFSEYCRQHREHNQEIGNCFEVVAPFPPRGVVLLKPQPIHICPKDNDVEGTGEKAHKKQDGLRPRVFKFYRRTSPEYPGNSQSTMGSHDQHQRYGIRRNLKVSQCSSPESGSQRTVEFLPSWCD